MADQQTAVKVFQASLAALTITVIICCGGPLIVVGFLGRAAREQESKHPKTKQPVTVYAANEDLVCARTHHSLDKSPLLFQDDFVRVPKGTEVIMTDARGVSGRVYLGISAGGETVYIYQDVFDRKFRKVRQIEPR